MGRASDLYDLAVHPDTPPKAVESVTAQVSRSDPGELWIEFAVRPAATLLLPPESKPIRTDELWRKTCFELFLTTRNGDGYLEFNFSPSFQWAAYQFDRYRENMRELTYHDPEICVSLPGEHLFLAVEALDGIPDEPLRLGLSAVIEETDGTKSYWALAHPPGKPDFHHPDCFTLELPPPNAA